MNGPEHFRRAEQLVAQSIRQREQESHEDESPLSRLTMAQAQVHATLALVAAVANTERGNGSLTLADAPGAWDNGRNGDGATWKSVLS